MLNRIIISLFALSLGVSSAPWLGAADNEGSEVNAQIPDAKQTMTNVLANLSKATEKKSFSITFDAQGGVAKSADHQLDVPSLAVSYTADLLRGTMKLTGDREGFRTQTKGALRDKNTNLWQDISATKEGKVLAHLFSFPHVVLQKALTKPEKVEWLGVGEAQASGTVETGGTDEAGKSPAKAPEDQAPKGSTQVNPKEGAATAGEKLPHRARITLNREVADYFWSETKTSTYFDATGCCGISEFLSLVDSRYSEGYLEVELDKDMVTPKSMHLLVLTGLKRASDQGGTEKRDFSTENHVAFKFNYTLEAWDNVDRFVVPPDAQKLLR